MDSLYILCGVECVQGPIKVFTRTTFYSAHRSTPRDAPEDFTVPPGKRPNISRRSFYNNSFLQKRGNPVIHIWPRSQTTQRPKYFDINILSYMVCPPHPTRRVHIKGPAYSKLTFSRESQTDSSLAKFTPYNVEPEKEK